MNENILIGLVFALIAGVFSGSFSFPMKLTVGWKWQHIWMIFAISGLLIMPIIVALCFIPDLWFVYKSTDTSILVKVFLFGMVWGIGVICFGLGLEYLGIALGMPIMLGLMICFGALFPIFLFHPEELASPKGIDIMMGSIIILGGIILCSIAGSKRSKAKDEYKSPT